MVARVGIEDEFRYDRGLLCVAEGSIMGFDDPDVVRQTGKP